ncbi:MAG: P63C domain-containing protein [Armatimonadetes bacterium]|nr:P63C domain-containing protein [Armatimonadota bacterium]
MKKEVEGAVAQRAAAEEDVIVQATHGSPDHPLRIAELEIPCYVLEDGRRVVVLGGMLNALDMSQGTAGRGGGNRLTKFIGGKSLQPFIPEQLADAVTRPIRFRTPSGALAYGYQATVLADLCEAIVEASKGTKLNYQLEHIVKRAEILLRGFTRVGIIALIDEATGFQEFRAREALEEILRRFISEELLKWAKTFPDEFYKQMFRLRGWQYSEFSVKRPGVAGKITNDVVYERLAPGVLDELRRITPKDGKGRRRHRYHQHLTEDIGHPRLREHLASVTTLMKASSSWRTFYSMLNRALPKWSETIPMDFGDDLGD